MEIELFGKHSLIFGLKGTGKSNLVAHILDQPIYENHLVYDLAQEHADNANHRVVPDHTQPPESTEEFQQAFSALVTENEREMRPDLFVGEEVSRYAPNNGKAPEALLDLADQSRHYGVGFLGTARRPAQVNTTLVELADYIVVFRVRGKNDVKRLNAEADGLGDRARELDPFEFIVVDSMRDSAIHEPVPEYETTGEL